MGGSRKGDWESSKSSKSGGWKGDGKWWPLGIAHKDLHPRNLTWIPKIAMFKRRHILKTIIFGICVRFQGGYSAHGKHNWAVLSDEQMSNGYPFSLLNDEQMSNKVRVKHQPDKDLQIT